MAVTLDAAVCRRYPRFSLYNSPYVAHERGCAIDLYPDADAPGRPTPGTTAAPSPVAGEVLETRTVGVPSKPYAAAHDHLLLVDTGAVVARILHVDPTVAAGDTVAVGDSLGTLVRSGFFAPWVDDHIHLEFREHDADHHRASGSLPLELPPDLSIRPLDWDGTGTVVAAGETYAVLDSPSHPAPGETFVGVAPDDASDGRAGGVLDGGLVHYEGSGVLGGGSGPVSLLGQRVGVADGRTVDWDDVAVLANGERITGLSLFCGQDANFGAKLVCPDVDLPVGTDVGVTITETDEPTVLG
jgi:hypothetical protein